MLPSRDIIEAIFPVTNDPQPGITPLHGGDINSVYLVSSQSIQTVLKTNRKVYPGMFPAEAMGLEALRMADTFRVPEVLQVSEQYLLLEYIPEGEKQLVSAETYGRSLAGLHLNQEKTFGFTTNNYIGSLPQRNGIHDRGADFYREERLLPQFETALNKGYRFKNLEVFLKKLETLIPEEKPSLIHGDLWSGNYMVSHKGEPCLIDPATCYAHREMDHAMMALFGGFPSRYTASYNEVYPLSAAWESRIPLWQLYYMLVHLNIFGSGYYSRCVQIMRRYL